VTDPRLVDDEAIDTGAAAAFRAASGERAANYRMAKALLEIFGYDAVVAAIDWRRTRYAG